MSEINELSVEGLKLINDLIQTNSLKRTAGNLRMSPPAASRLLSKLRDIFNDELFTRNGSLMMPTKLTLSIQNRVTRELISLEDLVQQPKEFDPSTSQKIFRISVHEQLFAVHFVPFCEKILELAPHVRLEVYGADKSIEKLKSGELDFVLMPLNIGIAEEIISLPVLDISWKILVRKGHPVLKKITNRRIHSREIAKLGKIELMFGHPLKFPDRIDSWAKKDGFVPQETVVWVPYIHSALDMVKNSDLTFMVYSRLADKFCAEDKQLQSISLDPKIGRYQVALKWHENSNADVACQWFRSVLASVFTAAPPPIEDILIV